jgi:hypothetical protein
MKRNGKDQMKKTKKEKEKEEVIFNKMKWKEMKWKYTLMDLINFQEFLI